MASNSAFHNNGHEMTAMIGLSVLGNYVWISALGLEDFDGTFTSERSAAGFNTGFAVYGVASGRRLQRLFCERFLSQANHLLK